MVTLLFVAANCPPIQAALTGGTKAPSYHTGACCYGRLIRVGNSFNKRDVKCCMGASPSIIDMQCCLVDKVLRGKPSLAFKHIIGKDEEYVNNKTISDNVMDMHYGNVPRCPYKVSLLTQCIIRVRRRRAPIIWKSKST